MVFREKFTHSVKNITHNFQARYTSHNHFSIMKYSNMSGVPLSKKGGREKFNFVEKFMIALTNVFKVNVRWQLKARNQIHYRQHRSLTILHLLYSLQSLDDFFSHIFRLFVRNSTEDLHFAASK